jgi:hypothetical protein
VAGVTVEGGVESVRHLDHWRHGDDGSKRLDVAREQVR